jgi:hypothetical protein
MMRRRQHGAALWLLLLAIVMAGSYAVYLGANRQHNPQLQARDLAIRLARAKEALIAYAVTDGKLPGRMLCPDLIGNGISPILSRNDCDAYRGWLPWKTLDIIDASDERGTAFHYVASPRFGGDRPLPLLNSDTPTELRFFAADGTLNDSVVAVIIAPRGGLDPFNADGDSDFRNGQSDVADDNDLIAVITRRELMAAVETRVVNEVKACLTQHTALAADDQVFPWPAALSNAPFRGLANRHFGQLPATQPGAGPDHQLQQNTLTLDAAKMALENASTATIQLSALRQLADAVSYARLLFDRIFTAAKNLNLAGNTAATALGRLESSIITSTDQDKSVLDQPKLGSQISPAEKTTLLDRAGTVQLALIALDQSLADNGLDVFPGELATRSLRLQAQIDQARQDASAASMAGLLQAIEALTFLFSKSATPNPDIAGALRQALEASLLAQNLSAAASLDLNLALPAIHAAEALLISAKYLDRTITASRVHVHATEISSRVLQLQQALRLLTTTPGAASALAERLDNLAALVSRIDTASSPIVGFRAALLDALPVASSAARTGTDFPAMASSTENVIALAESLTVAIASNGDNLAGESFREAMARYLAAQQALTDANTTEKGLVTYVLALQNPAVDLKFWVEILARRSAELAIQARKSTTASATKEDSASAFYAADQALKSITDAKGAIYRVETYLASPGSSSKKEAAITAVANTLSLLTALQGKRDSLDANLASAAAAAFPTLWLSRQCDFLQPVSGQTSWWIANDWGKLIFFQISGRTRQTTGKLSVNGAGAYHCVVLASGSALSHQDRSMPSSASFFEGANADPSRDGEASAPATEFSAQPFSGTFNDRLAY